eukprot:GHRQ01016970.1.p1 GENE.GHRQ01016970.1~~GHRQ01016970.1.p1  ORF type:complete len:146 (+),score=29.24 GHRQ01016970.1:369-806(+)
MALALLAAGHLAGDRSHILRLLLEAQVSRASSANQRIACTSPRHSRSEEAVAPSAVAAASELTGLITTSLNAYTYAPAFNRYNELNQQPAKHEPKVVDGRKTFQRFLKFCNDLPHGVDYEGYFSGWFKGAPFQDIKRGEQQQWQQ